jgi:hypothetical protein
MRYELFLRRPAESLDQGELAAVCEAAAQEGGVVHVDPYRDEEGALLGVDLGINVDQPAGAARLCRLALDVAGTHRLSLFDPQLGQTITKGDEELVQQRFDQGAAFDVAAPIATASSPSAGGLSPSVKLWLALIGVIALVLLVARGLSC